MRKRMLNTVEDTDKIACIEQAYLDVKFIKDHNALMVNRAYRELISELLLMAPQGNYALAISSAIKGEGVSSVAASTAVMLADAFNKRVVIVDGNLRNPNLHNLLELNYSVGLLQVIENEINLEFAIQKTVFSKLEAITSGGTTTEESVEILSSEGMRALINILKNSFDYVIIDCPPVLANYDAVILGMHADGLALVVRSKLTPDYLVKDALKYLRSTNVIGVVLNGA